MHALLVGRELSAGVLTLPAFTSTIAEQMARVVRALVLAVSDGGV
jgi:hypothetical protein